MNEDNVEQALIEERHEALRQIEDWLQLPVLVLGFVWLALVVIELIWGLNPFLNTLVYAIWVVFVIDFMIRMILAPQKLDYLRTNWLTAISLFLPALRVFSVFRIGRLFMLARAAPRLRLLKVVSSLNRGMRALRRSMKRRRFGYVISLSALVSLTAAAAMLEFENGQPGGFSNYGEALYWTAMMMTTLGSDYWPQSAEGRILTLLLALYAFAVFGFVTASLATYFIGRDADEAEGESAGRVTLQALHNEIAALREEINRMNTETRGEH